MTCLPRRVKASCAKNGVKLLGPQHRARRPGPRRIGPRRASRPRGGFPVDRRSVDRLLRGKRRHLHPRHGRRHRSRSARDRRATFLRNLSVASAKAAPHGLTLLLEPLNPRDRPDYFYSRAGEAASIIAELGAANVKLMFDIYHVGVTEGDILKKLERYLPVIGHPDRRRGRRAPSPTRARSPMTGCCARSIGSAIAAGSAANTSPRADTDAGLVWIKAMGLW